MDYFRTVKRILKMEHEQQLQQLLRRVIAVDLRRSEVDDVTEGLGDKESAQERRRGEEERRRVYLFFSFFFEREREDRRSFLKKFLGTLSSERRWMWLLKRMQGKRWR